MTLNKKQRFILQSLISQTGLTERRCKNYCERYNWVEEKIYNDPIIKSSLKAENYQGEEVITQPKKTRQKAQKPAKIEHKDNIITKKSKSGIDFDVEIIEGRETFNGKAIKMDSTGFYHPFASMTEINEWTKKHLKKK